MNDLIDRIMDMPLRQRVLLLVGGVFLLFGAYAYLLYWPRVDQITAKQESLTSLQRDRDKKAALVANLAQARQQVEDLKAALNKAVAQLPDTKEIPDLLSGISAMAREAGLEIAQFKQRPEVYREFYAEVPVEILVRGTFFQVETFFRRVAELTRIVNVGFIGMKAPNAIEGDPVRLETSCQAITFRFLDEKERAKIAKEREKKGKRK